MQSPDLLQKLKSGDSIDSSIQDQSSDPNSNPMAALLARKPAGLGIGGGSLGGLGNMGGLKGLMMQKL